MQETKEELTRKKAFEDLIKRPYFHVKPLPAVQLATWDSYIDYILTKEDAGSIVRLFERCLVACANYPGKSNPFDTAPKAVCTPLWPTSVCLNELR